MFRSIADDIKYQFQTGNSITRLIIVNVAIFLILIIIRLFGNFTEGGYAHDTGFFSSVTRYLYLSQDILFDAKHPWVFITHMFSHVGLFHILFNMLVLYWFGRIAGDLLGDHRMMPLYILSGLTGALIYLLTASLFHPFSTLNTLNGASGAVLGIVAAAGMTAPDYQMRLLLFGDVKLKFVVFGLLVMYLASLAALDNSGGQMAHFGGAGFGFLYVHMLRQGHDLTKGFRRLISFFKKRPRKPSRIAKRKVPIEIRYKTAARQHEIKTPSSRSYMGEQERLDYILEKIKKTGYQSLDDEEKRFLDDASQK